jgi:hypothetical protein
MYVHAVFHGHEGQKQKEPQMEFLKLLIAVEPALLNRAEATVKIANAPYMPLSVENIGLGPRGLPALSVCHYGEQNGDLMRDPEMCFEMEIEGGTVSDFHPYYYRNDYAGYEQNAVDGQHVNAVLIRSQREFSETWSRNLFDQGFLAAYQASKNL